MNKSAAYRARSRKRKKLRAKSNWFKQTDTNEEEVPGGGNQEDKKNQKDVEKQGQGKKAPMPHGWKARGPKRIRQQLRMSTVLFVEDSHTGSLQKQMRKVVEKLATMLGFRVRISERAGTPLSSLLSNPWGGQSCRRKEGECYPCHQNSEVKEPCTLRNVLYESECGSCNQLGNQSERDKDTLSDTRMPSIYVGESARSLAERSREHWGDFNKGKIESHMYTHWQEAHRGEDPSPHFNFRVVKSFKSALSRQVAEAVRIQLRGSVLNVKGLYNRSKLTRLVVDEEWDKKVWAEAWVQNTEIERDEIVPEDLKGQTKYKKKRREDDKPPPKRIKRDPKYQDCSEVKQYQVSGGGGDSGGTEGVKESKYEDEIMAKQSNSKLYSIFSMGELVGAVRKARTQNRLEQRHPSTSAVMKLGGTSQPLTPQWIKREFSLIF